jgi:multimeric flavodoxin WrbA
MAKEILVLTGSPRRKGNSDKLADAFIRGAVSAGNTVHKFETAFMDIHGCRGCNACLTNRTEPCMIKDDFYQLIPHIEKSEAAVFASPVYFLGVSAQLKAVWDRFHSFTRGEGRKRLAIKESVLLLSLGDTKKETYCTTAASYSQIAKYFGWTDRGIIAAGGMNGINDIQGHETLARAEALGKSM